MIASPADLAARLDALDSTPGNVTFDNTSDTDGDGKPDLRFDVKIQKPLNGTADFDLDTSLLGGAIRLNGEIAVGADIVLNLAFGVESSKGPFIETGGGRGLSVSNISLSSNIDAGGQFGFLGVEVANPTAPRMRARPRPRLATLAFSEQARRNPRVRVEPGGGDRILEPGVARAVAGWSAVGEGGIDGFGVRVRGVARRAGRDA